MAKKKASKKTVDHTAAIKECISLLDPKGVGHVPSGSLGVYQDVLDKLNAAVAAEAADVAEEVPESSVDSEVAEA